MNDIFSSMPLLVGAWVISAGTAAFIGAGLVAYWRKEGRMPLATAYEDLEERHDDLRTQRDAAMRIIAEADQARQDREVAQSQLLQLKDDLLRLEPDRQDLLRVRGELTQAEQQRSEVIQVVQQLRDQEGLLKTAVQALGQQKADMTAAIESLSDQKGRLAGELADLTGRLTAGGTELQRSTAELTGLQRELDHLRPTIQQLREQAGELGVSVATTTQALAELKATHDALRNEHGRLSTEKAELALQVVTLKSTVEKLNAELSHLAEQLPPLRKERAECEALLGQRNALKQEITALEASLARMRGDRDRRNGGTPEERYRDLWQPLDFKLVPANKQMLDEQAALRQVETLLRNRGFVFPERVVHAYHTALKTAEQAPITVLAGLSGTGKSALPRFYAESMGIHFVQLAVQPRWDSPQDLFGFFNHIEGRYKATELARALVQFERHNRKQWSLPKGWNHGREDAMCLVLLDEMNLARVEYYFSEFLSKLEARRGSGAATKQLRRDAEIAIDMGSLSEGEQPISFYPDLNVLFTGTMNEDESTQSLSDKVVDRACVLRFGRPKDLEPKHRTKASIAPTDGDAAKPWLTFENWGKWRRDLGDSDSKHVSTWINRMNAVLDHMQRPFAHRTAQSILAYVGNYPSWIPQRIELAMADQIEQRILPRLRGINLDENGPALADLGKLINETSDSALSKAYEDAKRSDRGTFLWSGVDRSDHG